MNSLLSGLLVILANDAGGAATTALNTFKASVDQTSDIQEVAAAGVQLEGSLITAAPGVESALIKDTTNLLVTDAVALITKIQQQAAANAASSASSASSTSTAAS